RGTYMVPVSEGAAGAQQLVSTGGGVLSYPQEYRDLEPNIALLRNLADASGGEYLNDVGNPFEPKPQPVKTFWPLWQLLLLLVTSALFFDIAWRRLNLSDWYRPASTPVAAVTRTDATVGAMKTVKSGRRDVDTQRKTMRERVEALAATSAPASDPPAPLQNNTSDVSGPMTATKREAAPAPQPGEGYANRLMSAKRRAKEQIREQSKEDV
ncbi:MAG TPA: hypothetical protein VFV87_17125, partial [Pirellulaceae bacterium]|nr:hypothetical protein [Pirellulaceae bacterium]